MSTLIADTIRGALSEAVSRAETPALSYQVRARIPLQGGRALSSLQTALILALGRQPTESVSSTERFTASWHTFSWGEGRLLARAITEVCHERGVEPEVVITEI